MTPETSKDDKPRSIGLRLSDEEMADLPPASSDAARVRTALAEWREMRGKIDSLPEVLNEVRTLRTELSDRVDTHSAAIVERLDGIRDGADPFHRLALEADARDIETGLADVWVAVMSVWRQTLNTQLNVAMIREKLIDGDGDPQALEAQRRARLEATLSDQFRDCDARAGNLHYVTQEWRQMRDDEANAPEDADAAPSTAAAE